MISRRQKGEPGRENTKGPNGELGEQEVLGSLGALGSGGLAPAPCGGAPRTDLASQGTAESKRGRQV